MSLGRHTLFNLAGAGVPILTGLATVPVYLRHIGPERYGVLAVVWALIGYFSFFDAGFGRATTQRMSKIAEDAEQERSRLLWTALLATLALGVAASAVLLPVARALLADRISMDSETREEVAGAVLWMLPALPILLPTTVLQGALQARLRFLEVNAIQTFGAVVGQTLPLIVAVSGHVALSALVPTVLLSRLLVLALLLHQSTLHVPLMGRPVIDRGHLGALARYGGWVSLVSFLGPMLVTIDRLVIAALSGAKAVAVYTVPYDLASRSQVVSSSLSTALFPRLSSASSADFQTLVDRATAALISFMTPVVAVGMLLAQPFLGVWIDLEFASLSAGVAELILLGFWFNALAIPSATGILASGRSRTVAIIYVLEIPIYFGLLWVGLKYAGVVGAAGAWCLRVIVDTSLLLGVTGSLRRTYRLAAPNMILLGVVMVSVLVLELSVHFRLALAALIVLVFFIRNRDQLAQAVLNRRPAS